MESEGGGKVKHKRNQIQSKPYDRNTSFLGKIKNSVKGLLVPSWLSGSSSKNEVEVHKDAQASLSKANSESGNNLAVFNSLNLSKSEQNVEPHDIGATQDLDDSGVITFPKLNRQEGGHSRYAENLSNASFEPPPPNVNIANLYRDKDGRILNNSDQLTPALLSTQRLKDAKERKRQLSDSVFDEADNATDTPIRPIMILTGPSGRLSPSESAKRQRLWSPESMRQGKPFTVPVTDKPSFNTSLFSSPNQSSSLLGNSLHESSFYSGKTRFGGAAAERKKTLNTSSPYKSSLPLRKQVKANPLNQSLNATTSATAQRILETLDRMSTPLRDARRIPQGDANNDSVLSFTPSSYRRSSFLTASRSTTRPLQIPNVGAPKSQHQSISQAVIAKNRNTFSIVDKRQSTVTQESEDMDACRESSGLIVSMDPSLSRLRSDTTSVKTAQAPGKVKVKKFSQHISSKETEDDEVVEVPNLRTDFTLPITSINPISLNIKSPSVASSSIPTTDNKAAPLKFTFSTPIEERRKPISNLTTGSLDKGFKFSTPLKAASDSKINAAGAEEGSKSSPEPAVGASSVVSTAFSSTVPSWGSTAPRPNVADIGGTSSSFKTYNKWPENGSSAASDVVTAVGFSLAPAASLKSGSVMDILGKNPVGTSNSSVSEDLMQKFKKPTGSWDCDGCMLNNKPEATKCVACETPKPGVKASSSVNNSSVSTNPLPSYNDDLMSKFKKPSGSWDCSACLITNKPEVNKCVACETTRPGSNQPFTSSTSASSSNLSAMFKKPPGNWECDTCMIQNVATALKCIACDTAKPGLQTAGVVPKPSETSKASAIAISPTGGFVFNVPAASTTTTATTIGSGGFKFGNTEKTTTASTSSTAFQFGPASASKDSSRTSENNSIVESSGFKFGNSDNSVSASSLTGGFIFGHSSAQGATSTTNSSAASGASSAGGFVFGSTASTASSKPGFQFGSTAKTDLPSLDNHHESNGSIPSVAGGFQFGTKASSSTASNTDITPDPKDSLMKSHLNFSFNPAAHSQASTFSVSQPVVTNSQIASNLFQFVSSSASPQSNAVGLGMNSVTGEKPITNGGFGASFNPPSYHLKVDGAGSLGAGTSTSSTIFSFGQASTVSLPQPSKRSVDLEDADAPKVKKSVQFGSVNNEPATNGLFAFDNTTGPKSVFGSNASTSTSAPTPFVFGSAPQSSGFQFSLGTAQPGVPANFSFNASSAPIKPATEIKSALSSNFNFGTAPQLSSVTPFQFAAKPADASSSSTPFAFNAASASAPGLGTFNIGSSSTDSQRRKIKAVRKLKK